MSNYYYFYLSQFYLLLDKHVLYVIYELVFINLTFGL